MYLLSGVSLLLNTFARGTGDVVNSFKIRKTKNRKKVVVVVASYDVTRRYFLFSKTGGTSPAFSHHIDPEQESNERVHFLLLSSETCRVHCARVKVLLGSAYAT